MPHGIPGYLRSDTMKNLLFLDSSGRLLLKLPAYGWNEQDLVDWIEACGWDHDLHGQRQFDIDWEKLGKLYPNYYRCPRARVGLRYVEPTTFRQRLRKRFGRR